MFITFEARKTERNIYIFDLYFLPSKLQKVVLALRCANKLRRLCLFVFEKLRTSDFSNITYKSKQFFMIKKYFVCLYDFQKPLSRSKMSFLSCDFSCVHPCLTEAKHFLLFFYYGAILFGTQQDWESMQFYLEQAISLPATGHVSQITIDAYKK